MHDFPVGKPSDEVYLVLWAPTGCTNSLSWVCTNSLMVSDMLDAIWLCVLQVQDLLSTGKWTAKKTNKAAMVVNQLVAEAEALLAKER